MGIMSISTLHTQLNAPLVGTGAAWMLGLGALAPSCYQVQLDASATSTDSHTHSRGCSRRPDSSRPLPIQHLIDGRTSNTHYIART